MAIYKSPEGAATFETGRKKRRFKYQKAIILYKTVVITAVFHSAATKCCGLAGAKSENA
jgi:hypothetical protein